MPGFQRARLSRLAAVDKEIREHRYPNANTLARSLQVEPRTIYRDLDCLRDDLGAPIEYDSHQRGYYYREPSYRLPFPQVTEGECLALFLGERLLQQYQGTPLAGDLQRLFQKIAVLLPANISLDPEHLARTYSVSPQAAESGDTERFRKLIHAVRKGRQLELLYWTAWSGETNRRVVDPYHLTIIDGEWFLVGYCHLREAVRMFAPNRMRELRETGEACACPPNFRIAEYLDASFRMFRGSGPAQEVLLRFGATAARYIREKTWHPTQQLDDQADGGLVLRLRVNHLAAVKRWAMSWGADCEVLAPAELREEIVTDLQKVLASLKPAARSSLVKRIR